MKRLLLAAIYLVFSISGVMATDAPGLFPPKPEPAVYVHDYAQWLTGEQANTLEQQLRAMHDTTSSQIVVMIRTDIGDYDRVTYATELGNRWGIGRSEKDNGVVMLIVTEGNQRGIFISPGYGLEGALTDLQATQIARDMAPTSERAIIIREYSMAYLPSFLPYMENTRQTVHPTMQPAQEVPGLS
ncbi:MAG: TPM domain-containing protein [Candidatus Parvibacillus calidus]|nr:MAG: TPM domain-containing protein [Candidatus Parvibacillus calidus]